MRPFTATESRFDQNLEKVIEAFQKSQDVVCSTMGPAGRTVLINGETFNPVNTKDGITVLEHCAWKDPLQHVIAQLLIDAARKTVRSDGDGTTTTVLLASELAKRILPKVWAEDSKLNPYKLGKALEQVKEQFVDMMRKVATPANTEDLLVKVATISANNNAFLGKLIGELANRVGEYGSITALPSPTSKTYTEVIEGWSIDSDRPLPMDYAFIDAQKRCAEINNPYTLLVEMEITTFDDRIKGVLEAWVKLYQTTNRPLVIVCNEMNGGVLSTVLSNFNKGLPVYVVRAPFFAEMRDAAFEDMGVVMGGKRFSFRKGTSLKDFKPDDLGSAEKIILHPNRLIVKPIKATSENRIAKQKQALIDQQEDANLTAEARQALQVRVARLSAGIGFIFVGGATQVEHNNYMMSVDDSYKAVFSAMRGGVVAGGGATMLRMAKQIAELPFADWTNGEFEVAHNAIVEALRQPFLNILNLAKVPINIVVSYEENIYKESNNITYSILDEDFVNAFEAGIIEPANVPIAALTNAISIIKELAAAQYSLQIELPKNEN